jgi:hypothetical protein
MCELSDLMRFAKKYASLGSAVQDQMDDLLAGDDSMNPNAINLIKDEFNGLNEDLDQILSDYFDVVS